MANFQLIKDIAKAKGITLDELAEKVGIQAQAIHLMVRNGSTKIETLERIARELEVPAYIFMDYDFDLRDFKKEVIMGGQNAFSYFGGSHIHNGEVKKDTGCDVSNHQEIMKIKDEVIETLRSQIAGLNEDKIHLREALASHKEDIKMLKDLLEKFASKSASSN